MLDLFNVDYVYRDDVGPADDSAGIGAWGLMGWGALGWQGNDGPNSFSAWILVELGWVDLIRPLSRSEDMRLAPIMAGRAAYEILLPNRERFLISNRQREGNYYDRHIPGEGLLIWHDGTTTAHRGPDLECADGKWVEAGYPVGVAQDASRGGDNLDFWSHDREYARTHAGNVGDATDPFDGVEFRSFSPRSNPDSHSATGSWSFKVEDIGYEPDGTATAHISPVPLVDVTLNVLDDSGDGVVLAGEGATLGFRVAVHRRFAGDLRAVFVTEDRLVEFENPEFEFRMDVGGSSSIKTYDTSRGTSLPKGLPRLRVPAAVDGAREVPLQMQIHMRREREWELLWQEDIRVEVI